MTNKRTASKLTKEQVSYELRSEIRRILRKHYSLTIPLQMFRRLDGRPPESPAFQVCFDIMPPIPSGSGFRVSVKELTQPHEAIEDLVYDLARGIWHLKDWLKRWAKLHGANTRAIEEHVEKSQELLVAADLINTKKHGGVHNRSGVYPYINLVHFDTSNSGVVEFWYRGDWKETILAVSNPNPIPFSIPIWQGDGTWQRFNDCSSGTTCLGDAADVLMRGFKHWSHLLESLGVLEDYETNPESLALRTALALLDESNPSTRPAPL